MAEYEEVCRRIEKLEASVNEMREVLFNGIQDSSKKMVRWLETVAPTLMTEEKHQRIEAQREALEQARAEGQRKANEALGRRRDRLMKLVVIISGAGVTGLFTLASIWLRATLGGP